MTDIAVSVAGVVLSLLVAWGVASKGYGKMEGKMDSMERDIERLDRDKASAVALDAFNALLSRIDADMKSGLAEIKAEIRAANRRFTGRSREDE